MEASIITHSKIIRILFLCFASMLLLFVNSGWAATLIIKNNCDNIVKITAFCPWAGLLGKPIPPGTTPLNIPKECKTQNYTVWGMWGGGDVAVSVDAATNEKKVVSCSKGKFLWVDQCYCTSDTPAPSGAL